MRLFIKKNETKIFKTWNGFRVKIIVREISRSELEKEWGFEGWPTKSNMKFPGVLFINLQISKGCNTFTAEIRLLKLPKI